MDEHLLHQFIDELRIRPRDPNMAPLPTMITRAARGAGQAPVKEGVIDVGAVLCFVDKVPERQRQDVLNSVQLAQRAASGLFKRQTETEQWYGKFQEVLERVGWVAEQYAYHKHEQYKGNLRVDQAALQVIAAVATQNALGVLTAAVGALRKLAEKDGTITLFDQYALAEASGNFQLGAVEIGKNGALSMGLGGFYYRALDRRHKALVFSWGANEIEFWTSAQRMTLNEQQYAGAREKVMQKLGQPLDYIESLTLAA